MTGICKLLLLTSSCHSFVTITYRYINIITAYLIACLQKTLQLTYIIKFSSTNFTV